MTEKVTRIESAKRAHTTIEALERRIEEIDCDLNDRMAAEGGSWMATVEPLEATLRRLQQRHLDVPTLLADHNHWVD